MNCLPFVNEITMTNANSILQSIVASDDATIDLSGVNHCDTAGIAVLLQAKSSRLANNKDIQYINVPQQVAELASFLNVSTSLFK